MTFIALGPIEFSDSDTSPQDRSHAGADASLTQRNLFRIPSSGGLRLCRLQVEVDPHRDVVRRLFPAAYIAVDSDIDQPVAGLRREQEVIDAQAMVFLPGARLIVPECVLSGGVGDGTQRVREPKAEQRLKAFAGGGTEQGVVDPGRR